MKYSFIKHISFDSRRNWWKNIFILSYADNYDHTLLIIFIVKMQQPGLIIHKSAADRDADYESS